jgi:tetratricopeptide (TPR) repeat protein
MPLDELLVIIQNFRSLVAEGQYDDALRTYYTQLDKPLYCSGENLIIIDLLNAFLDNGKTPFPSIDRGSQERICRSLITVYQLTGQPNNAISLLKWLLDSSGFSQRPRIRAILLRYLSRLMLSLGQLKSAEESIISGIELCREAGEAGLVTGLRRQHGILLAYEGRYYEARDEIASLPKGFGKHNHSDFSVYVDRFAYALEDQTELSKTVYYANEMKKLSEKYHYKNDEVVAYWSLGLSYLLAGNLSKAENHLDSAVMLCNDTNYVELKPDILLTRARFLLASKNNIHIVTETAKDALAIASKCGYRLKQAEIFNFLGALALDYGDSSVAEQYAHAGYEAAFCDGPPHWYKRDFKEAERILNRLNVIPPMKYCSCFISYSHDDKEFAQKLYSALKIHDIECWLDDHKILPGDYFLGNIDEGIKEYDKVLLCCSRGSLTSFWVDTEIEKAVHKERVLWNEHQERILVMIPVDLDGFLHRGWQDPKASILRARLSADFTEWKKNEEKFYKQLEKLLLALRVPQKRQKIAVGD